MDRRSFLVGVALTGAAAMGLPLSDRTAAEAAANEAPGRRPNILLVMVDQLREPMWFGSDADKAAMPNLARLRAQSVNFTNAFAAATCCCPSRASLLTGLYAHQHGLFMTRDYFLNEGFETWGHALKRIGYKTNWYGKLHIGRQDAFLPFGFDSGVPWELIKGKQLGIQRDPVYMDEFTKWFDGNAQNGPWMTAISLLNPHDICDAYRGKVPMVKAPDVEIVNLVSDLPPNSETTEQLQAKPRAIQVLRAWDRHILQQETLEGDWRDVWTQNANVYFSFQKIVDAQIGKVLDMLDAHPEIRDNTIVVFTADHGDMAGSHGILGKGWTAYDESTHVPLLVRDPTGRWAKDIHTPRTQLVSLVDIFGLMLTFATGSNDWRKDPWYSHLANRLDIAAILNDRRAPGRPYVIHTSDEYAIPHQPDAPVNAPQHVIGVRTADAKLVTYSHWRIGTLDIVPDDQDIELYDYSTERGRMELDNISQSHPALFAKMAKIMNDDAIPNELRRPVPERFLTAQARAMQFEYTTRAARP